MNIFLRQVKYISANYSALNPSWLGFNANIAEIDLRRFSLGLISLYQSAQQFNKELPEGYQPPSQETLNNWCNCDKQK